MWPDKVQSALLKDTKQQNMVHIIKNSVHLRTQIEPDKALCYFQPDIVGYYSHEYWQINTLIYAIENSLLQENSVEWLSKRWLRNRYQ